MWGNRSYGYLRKKQFINEPVASLVAQMVKCLPAMRETWVDPWVGKICLERKWQPSPVFLPGKSSGWRSLVRLQSMGSQRVGTTGMLRILSRGRQCFVFFFCFFSFPSKHVREIYPLQLTSWKLDVFGIYFCSTAPGPFLRASVIKSPPGLANWKCE